MCKDGSPQEGPGVWRRVCRRLLLPHDPNTFQSAPGAGGEREGGNAFGFLVLFSWWWLLFLSFFFFIFSVLFPEMLCVLVVLVFLFSNKIYARTLKIDICPGRAIQVLSAFSIVGRRSQSEIRLLAKPRSSASVDLSRAPQPQQKHKEKEEYAPSSLRPFLFLLPSEEIGPTSLFTFSIPSPGAGKALSCPRRVLWLSGIAVSFLFFSHIYIYLYIYAVFVLFFLFLCFSKN